MADFTPRPPELQAYLKDEEGKIDTKDRDRSFGIWLGDKLTKNGNQYLTGKYKGNSMVIFVRDGMKLVETEKSEQQEEPDW